MYSPWARAETPGATRTISASKTFASLLREVPNREVIVFIVADAMKVSALSLPSLPIGGERRSCWPVADILFPVTPGMKTHHAHRPCLDLVPAGRIIRK